MPDSDHPRLRVLFIHGKESHPHGTKARRLAEQFELHAEAMDTSDFAASVALQAAAVAQFRPDVVVGSSFGGAVLCALLQQGAWRGGSLLLAQAGVLYDPLCRLPCDVPVVLAHGRQDEVVPVAHSRQLLAEADPHSVLHEIDDDHRLTCAVEGGLLFDWVRQAYALARRP